MQQWRRETLRELSWMSHSGWRPSSRIGLSSRVVGPWVGATGWGGMIHQGGGASQVYRQYRGFSATEVTEITESITRMVPALPTVISVTSMAIYLQIGFRMLSSTSAGAGPNECGSIVE